MKKLIYILFLALIACDVSNTPLPDELNGLPVLEIFVSDDNYLALLQNKTLNKEIAARLSYKGKHYKGFVRASGAASRTYARWGYRVRLEGDEQIEGLSKFNLSSQVNDPTMVYTTIATHLYKQNGFPVFNANHVFVRINSKDAGLYPIFEKVEYGFFERQNLNVAELFKAGSQIPFSLQSEKGKPMDLFDKKIPEYAGFNSINKLFHAIDTVQSQKVEQGLAQFIDVDQYMRYHVTTTLINNIDAFQNNFFFWKERFSEPLKMIPWDFDLSFSHERDVGFYGRNKLIDRILEDETLFNRYKAELKNQLQNSFTEANIFPIIDSTSTLIEVGYNKDPFYGAGRYNQTQQINRLKSFITNRRAKLLNNMDGFIYKGE